MTSLSVPTSGIKTASEVERPVSARPIDPAKSLIARFWQVASDLHDVRTFDLCALVTAMMLFLYAGTDWYLTVPMSSVTLCALFLPCLRRSPKLWFLVVVLMVSANFYDRLLIDNHKYLMTYWCLAMFLASLQTDPDQRDRMISFNGRMLLGLCFGIAVIAKLVSPDYLNGGFFQHTLLTDSRFKNFAWLVGGVHRSTLSEIGSAINDVQDAYLLGVDPRQVRLASSPRFLFVVKFMTWWTIGIESAIAVTFLAPFRTHLLEWGRRYFLWIFLFSTYSVALVSGFAWLLAVMGLSQLPNTRVQYRIIYILIMAVALQLYEVHYVSLARSFFDYVLPGAGSP